MSGGERSEAWPVCGRADVWLPAFSPSSVRSICFEIFLEEDRKGVKGRRGEKGEEERKNKVKKKKSKWKECRYSV